jgi:methyl-accepting chemotaxis protein
MLAAATALADRDPLTSAETDQLREAAQLPNKRLKLVLQFARARMATIEQLRSDPRLAADRGKQIHDLLQDVGNIVDELDDNIENYATRKADIRKALKDIIEGVSEMQLKLRTIKESATGDAAKEAREYSFVLESATESVNGLADTARETMDEQAKLAKDKQLQKWEERPQ